MHIAYGVNDKMPGITSPEIHSICFFPRELTDLWATGDVKIINIRK